MAVVEYAFSGIGLAIASVRAYLGDVDTVAIATERPNMNPEFLNRYYASRDTVAADELLDWLGDWQ